MVSEPPTITSDDELVLRVLPLGGCGEVGLNATLLLCGSDALLIDCGVLLGIEDAPGVDKAVPGFEPLFREDRKVHGVVLTHGHEDHIGALSALLAELDLPVFGSPFTIALTRMRMTRRDRPIPGAARHHAKGLIAADLGSRVAVGPFRVELVRMTHSLPEAAALLIETPAGRVLHTGDFRLDPEPYDGRPSDLARLQQAGEEGIDLLLGDSTNAEVPGRSPSETEVANGIESLIKDAPGRVVVALMASHLHRLQAIVRAARRHGRRIALVGRALQDIWRLGIEQKILDADPSILISEERMAALPRNETLIVATGTQGERGAGLARIAGGKEAALRPMPKDIVIMSARVIPGNERQVRRTLNALLRFDVEVITQKEATVHASGHGHCEEQRELLQLVKPRCFVPVHGERSMLEAHANTARALGLEQVEVIEDGQSVLFSKRGGLRRGPEEAVSRRALDMSGRVLDWGDVRDRNRIGRSGLVVCSMALNHRDLVGPPVVSFRGLTPEKGLELQVLKAIETAIEETRIEDPIHLRKTAESAVRNVVKRVRGIAPEVVIHTLFVEPSAIH